MTSRIRLYNIPDLQEEKNYIIEEIGTKYLAGFTPQVDIFNFQYQRLETTKAIKINLSQLFNAPNPEYMFNYCRIDTYEEDGETIISTVAPAFYYVQGIKQESKSTIKIYLKLDVLNTFYDEWKEKMNNGTYIARGHENRFKPFLRGYNPALFELVHIFNRVPEGDNLPLYELESERTTIRQTTKGDTDENPLKFYLIYRSAEDGRPCIDLAANRQLKIGEATTGPAFTLSTSQIVTGRYYYIIGDIAFSVSGSRRQYSAGNIPPWTTWSDYTANYSGNGILIFWKQTINGYDYICFKFSSTTQDVNCEEGSFIEYAGNYPNYEFRTLDQYQYEGEISITTGKTLYFSSTYTYNQDLIKTFQKTEIDAGISSARYLGAISQLDKTDNKIVKVIECPYCPVEYSYNSSTGIYTFPSEYFPNESELENPKFLRTYELGKEFSKVRVGDLSLNAYLIDTSYKSVISDLVQHPQVNAFLKEPKLYTSPYFCYTFLYDSFAKQIKLENYEHTEDYYTYEQMIFYYKQSANVSSALLFEARTGSEVTPRGGFTLKISEENFPRIVTASRNNEVALFSSSYLDYLKNGFNYDKKKLQENIGYEGTMAALQTLGSVLSFALSGATGGVSAIGGISLAIGAASSFASMGKSAVQGAEALEQKINLLKAQSYTVSSIDDLDFFNEYGKNKLQIVRYQLGESDYNRIKTRFQYFGYAVDKYANPWPFYFNGRHNFNYLKCDPIFVQNPLKAIPEEFLNEISEKLRAGVTIWHSRFYEYNNYGLNKDYENIEQNIIDLL